MVDDGTVARARADRPLPPWPPPGLERIQGDLYGVAARGGLAGAFLVLPLLFVVTRDSGFATLGPLADAWWVTLALAIVGLALGLDVMVRTARVLRRTGSALRDGYDPFTVLWVLADVSRDMGFLLAGGRHFSVFEAPRRETLLRTRVLAAVLLAAAGLWLILAFSLGLLFAARGVLSAAGLQLVTLVPAAGAYVVGGLAHILQERRVRRARRTWHDRPGSTSLTMDEVRGWRQAVSEADAAITPPEPEASGSIDARGLEWAGIAVGTLSVAVALPILTLVPVSAVGPILTTVSVPAFDTYRPRAARAEAYRTYAIGADPSVTAEEAGRILHAITYAGSGAEPGPGERPVQPRIAEPWIPGEDGGENPLGLDPFAWGDSLLGLVVVGLDAEERTYLSEVATHPLAEDFSRLARAPSLDAASGRWDPPFPPGLTMATLPVPRFGPLRAAANTRIAAAGLALAEGREDDAERTLAEVVSVGFLLADDAPTLLDNLVGYAIVEAGGAALEDFYRVAGRPGESAQLSRLRQVADRSAGMMQTRMPRGTEAWVRSLPGLVLDSALVRGLRWEYFINLATMAPCLNANRIVFGTDQEYDAFMGAARESLVRWPSEEPLFELARGGWIGSVDPGPPGILERIAGLYMSSGENSCARTLHQVGASSF